MNDSQRGAYVRDMGDAITDLWETQSEWSQRTFGSDAVKGPIGSLKHLAKEVQETLADPTDRSEYADLLILICDSSRRAGMTLGELLAAANAKMVVNQARTWPKPTNLNEPVEHDRSEEADRQARGTLQGQGDER